LKSEIAFDLGIQTYTVHQLSHDDSQALQALYEKCLDYMLLVDGHPAGPNAGEKEFYNVPPGKSPDDKFMFGIINHEGELVGLLDVLQGYPEATTWWIGLLLMVPEARSQGIGLKTVEGLAEFARSNGGRAIMLGVVEENGRAYKFWTKVGFEFVYRTEPQRFGEKTQAVIVMRRRLVEDK